VIIWTAMFGLQELAEEPETIPPGSYAKLEEIVSLNGKRIIVPGYWHVRVLDKSRRHGNQLKWRAIDFEQLPKRIRAEALLLGINL
jgi:hypothetical protein